MNENQKPNMRCEEIVELINELLDGDMDDDRCARAKELLAMNPQCNTLYQTLMRTIELYRARRAEVSYLPSPKIDWSKIESCTNQEKQDGGI